MFAFSGNGTHLDERTGGTFQEKVREILQEALEAEMNESLQAEKGNRPAAISVALLELMLDYAGGETGASGFAGSSL